MPLGIAAWTSALLAAGEGYDPMHPPLGGVDNGYALPDPNVLAGIGNDVTRGAFFTTWLKLRPALLYRLRSSAFRPFKASQWRRILGLEIYGTKSESTHAGKERELFSSSRLCWPSALTDYYCTLQQTLIQFSHQDYLVLVSCLRHLFEPHAQTLRKDLSFNS